MRRGLVLLASLLLAGCVEGSASYYIDGSDHALTVRAEQAYFWDGEVALKLVAVNLPQCQRVFRLARLASEDIKIDLYANGEQSYVLRAGTQAWQVDAANCAQQPAGAAPADAAPLDRLGTFKLDADNKMVFEKAAG